MTVNVAPPPQVLKAAYATPREWSEMESYGFTPEQIDCFCRLRAVYPLIELIDTKEEFMKLLFLQWLYAKWAQAGEGATQHLNIASTELFIEESETQYA